MSAWCKPGRCEPGCHHRAYWHTGELVLSCECKCHPDPRKEWRYVASD
jgi:hypothetical protein